MSRSIGDAILLLALVGVGVFVRLVDASAP